MKRYKYLFLAIACLILMIPAAIIYDKTESDWAFIFFLSLLTYVVLFALLTLIFAFIINPLKNKKS